MNSISHFLEEFGLIALEKQEKQVRLTANHGRDLDYESGLIHFNGIDFSFQVLGTESDNTLTWLWAWAEEQEEIPGTLIKASLELKEWGVKAGIAEFTVPSVDLSQADGHVIAIIASIVSDAACYYHDPYEGGDLFLLLFGNALEREPAFDVKGLTAQFSFLMTLENVNPRKALLAYFRRKELSFREDEMSVQGTLESGESLNVQFDALNKPLTINGSLITV